MLYNLQHKVISTNKSFKQLIGVLPRNNGELFRRQSISIKFMPAPNKPFVKLGTLTGNERSTDNQNINQIMVKKRFIDMDVEKAR